MSLTPSTNERAESALRILEQWPGYGPIAQVISTHPAMDFHVAGGVVRDSHLGLNGPPKDFDLFLRGDPVDSIVEELSHHGEITSGPFGAPIWSPAAAPQTRCDLIWIHRFYNGLWPCENIGDALNQFDCTANAIAIDLRDGSTVDPQNGRRDIRRRILRAVRFDFPDEPISATSRLTRNAVIWWRLIHYAASRRLTIEPVTRRWLREHRAYERCRDAFEAEIFPIDREHADPILDIL